MSNNKFAKLFEVQDGHQVLYRLSINTTGPENTTDIHITTWIDGVECGMKLSGFTDDINPTEKLKSISQEDAEQYFTCALGWTTLKINVNDPEIIE